MEKSLYIERKEQTPFKACHVGRCPRTAEEIKTHGHEVGSCDKGGLISSFVVTFSGTSFVWQTKEYKRNNQKQNDKGKSLYLLKLISGYIM